MQSINYVTHSVKQFEKWTVPIHFLKEFRDMMDKMKPPRVIRKSCDKTLTTATAVATVNCIDGFHKMAEYLLGNGYSYVLFGRYTSDHIEKLFGK